ncbi:hypothetical protein TrVFT333_002314 [Trichoderma virens FT-333]|nr:hypothetical protein TrVFT333_002314 [Trichoderma virens FT-333]
MLFLQSLTAVILAATSMAFKLPAGLQDGSYVAYTDDSGEDVFEPFTPQLAARLNITHDTPGISPPTRREPGQGITRRGRSSSALDARSDYHWFTWCGCGFDLNHANCDRAVQGIKDQCGKGCNLPHAQAWFTIADDVVAFLCDGGVASADRITTAAAKITEKCGWYIAGTAMFEEGLFYELNIGYMRYSPGLDFCADAASSPVAFCPH